MVDEVGYPEVLVMPRLDMRESTVAHNFPISIE